MNSTTRRANTAGALDGQVDAVRLAAIGLLQGEVAVQLGLGRTTVASIFGRIGRKHLGPDYRPAWERDGASVSVVLLGLADDADGRAARCRLVHQVERFQGIAGRARALAATLQACVDQGDKDGAGPRHEQPCDLGRGQEAGTVAT